MPSGPFIRHPWELARQRLLVRMLRTNGLLSNRQTVLDVGSGDGWLAGNLMKLLPPDSTCTCWDSAYKEGSRENGLLLIKDRPAENFSLLLMLDVLEHLEDDGAFFEKTVCSNLRGGGHALISVPAFSRLFSQHDIRLGHYRRYDKHQLFKLIADAGLTRLRFGGAFVSLLPLRLLAMLGQRLAGKDPDRPHELAWRGSRFTARIVSGLLYSDVAVCSVFSNQGIAIPGLSWWALCQKKF